MKMGFVEPDSQQQCLTTDAFFNEKRCVHINSAHNVLWVHQLCQSVQTTYWLFFISADVTANLMRFWQYHLLRISEECTSDRILTTDGNMHCSTASWDWFNYNAQYSEMMKLNLLRDAVKTKYKTLVLFLSLSSCFLLSSCCHHLSNFLHQCCQYFPTNLNFHVQMPSTESSTVKIKTEHLHINIKYTYNRYCALPLFKWHIFLWFPWRRQDLYTLDKLFGGPLVKLFLPLSLIPGEDGDRSLRSWSGGDTNTKVPKVSACCACAHGTVVYVMNAFSPESGSASNIKLRPMLWNWQGFRLQSLKITPN